MKKFIDEVYLTIQSGSGGSGAVSFERYKYKPIGKPNGGDGGRGGHVILRVISNLSELSHLKKISILKAKNGENGGINNKKGKDGEDVYLNLPPGVIIKDFNTKRVIKELIENDDQYIIAKGGRGGKGSFHFKSSTNRSPRKKEVGKKTLQVKIIIELKLLADIGLVGFPNAGKSTLLKKLTDAKPEINNYPFTTLTPNLGVFYSDKGDSYTLADIPGIIEEAHKGKGLGLQFLKHIERTKILAVIVDVNDNYLKNTKDLIKELKEYDEKMLEKEIVYIGNKIDLLSEEFKNKINKKYVLISALEDTNLNKLKKVFIDTIKKFSHKS